MNPDSGRHMFQESMVVHRRGRISGCQNVYLETMAGKILCQAECPLNCNSSVWREEVRNQQQSVGTHKNNRHTSEPDSVWPLGKEYATKRPKKVREPSKLVKWPDWLDISSLPQSGTISRSVDAPLWTGRSDAE